MNIAVIFAGGTGKRMNSGSTPKQFLEVHSVPILIHTIMKFEKCNMIDGIVVVSLVNYISYVKTLLEKYGIKKVVNVVAGGQTGQESIYNGLKAASLIASGEKDIVLIHDGVRPLIDVDTIERNIACVKENGNAITVTKAIETIVTIDDNENVDKVVDRTKCELARAPQSFYLKDILNAHESAIKANKTDFIDSATMMIYYGAKIHTVLGPIENIKVTTMMDYYLLNALLDQQGKDNE